MIGLNGYTISTGIVSQDLNGDNIVAIPLAVEDNIEIGWISLSELQLTNQAELYLKELEKIVHPFDVREGKKILTAHQMKSVSKKILTEISSLLSSFFISKKLKPSLLTGFFVV